MGKKGKKAGRKKTKPGKPTISACMIVKNEEELLPQCLQSIKDVVDEIIVVDTGSSDRTIEIARQYTDKIWVHPWKGSFSEARNHYLEYATGDWIFQIDADEELVAEDIPKVRQAVQDESVDAVMVQVVNRLREGRSEGVHSVERMFRNNGAIHYEGRVHNRVVGITKARVHPIRLIHYGYDLGRDQSRKKFERTVTLLKEDLKDDPRNPLTWHYLSCSYLSEGMMNEALESSLRAIELAEAGDERKLVFLWSHYNAAICLYRRKEYDRAEKIALDALKKYPKHIDSHCILLLIAYERGEWRKVLVHGSEYLNLVLRLHANPMEFDNLVTCSVNEAWNMHVLIGIAHFELGRIEMFEEAVERAVESAPERYIALRAAGIYLYNKGDGERARRYLERVLAEAPGEETALRLLGDISGSKMVSRKKPAITCCMIVKNEEAFLDQCLKSIKDYVDEIVIVDTGSTDGTVEIARQYTDKVYFHPWEESFSKARNQALRYASGDWIFQIDGDEELVHGSGEKLRDAVRSAGDADAFHVNIISTYSNGARRARHNFERLFRNTGVIHYEGTVHNRVVGACSIKESRIEVMHYGYDVDEKKAHEKFLRTTALLKNQIAEEPDNPMPHHYLGTSYLSRGMNEEAARESVISIELAEQKGDEHPLYIWARHNAAIAFFRMGDLDKAREYSRDALRKYPDHLDSYYTLTMVAGERSQWMDVLSYGVKYLELRDMFEKNPEKAGLVINATMNEGPAIHLLIGHARHALGEISEMEKEYQLAAELAGDKWQAWWNAGCFHLDRTGNLDRAGRYLEAALQEAPDQQEVWYMLAKLYSKKGIVQEEKRCLEKIWNLGTEDPVVLNRLASLCLEAGQGDFATRILEKMIRIDPSNYNAICSFGRLHQEQGNLENALGYFKRAVEVYPKGPEPWLHLGEISLELGQPSEARDFFERVLGLGGNALPAALYLCEIELRVNRIVEFVNATDKILKELQLNRERAINGLADMVRVLEEIRNAVKDRPRLEAQADKVLALLRVRVKEFGETIGQGQGRGGIDSRAPAH